MKEAVLALAGIRRDASVALRVDGRLVAAASEDSFVRVAGIGYAQSGGFPTLAAEACLRRAGLDAGDLTGLVVVSDDDRAPREHGVLGAFPLTGNGAAVGNAWRARLRALPATSIDPVLADAAQAVASQQGADLVLICEHHPASLTALTSRDGELRHVGCVAGWDRLTSMAGTLAEVLGCGDRDPYRSLERLGSGGQPEFLDRCVDSMGWRAPMDLLVRPERLLALVDELSAGLPGGLGDAATPHVRAQDHRRALAASFMARVADLVGDAAEHLSRSTRAASVVLGGALFENPRLNTRIREVMADHVAFAAVPGERGRAVGASLVGSPSLSDGASGLGGLALGPSFSEHEIKATLENCRLDYVYEPDWRRLLIRVSKMLSRGMVVGWCQGSAGFGPRSLGTRSILCDPSKPYARENLNVYLKQLPIAEPLPVSMTPGVADECLTAPVRSPYMLFDAPVKESARALVRAALDHRHRVQIHTVTVDQAPELCELLDVHVERTRVPGVINVNLSGPGEPTACTPRDAVRTLFSSATDALTVGRFLLMKDYWLLRSDVD